VVEPGEHEVVLAVRHRRAAEADVEADAIERDRRVAPGASGVSGSQYWT
jgi:hypothetical protein